MRGCRACFGVASVSSSLHMQLFLQSFRSRLQNIAYHEIIILLPKKRMRHIPRFETVHALASSAPPEDLLAPLSSGR